MSASRVNTRKPAPQGPRSPVQKRAHLTVRRLVDATVRILERNGVQGLTTRRVAAEAGVGVATVYDYFTDKYDLIHAVVRDQIEQLARDLSAFPHDPEQPMLPQFLCALLLFLDPRRSLAGVLLNEQPDILGLDTVETAGLQFVRLLDPMICELAGTLAPEELFLIRAAIRGMLLEFARSGAWQDEPERLARRMCAWIAAWPHQDETAGGLR